MENQVLPNTNPTNPETGNTTPSVFTSTQEKDEKKQNKILLIVIAVAIVVILGELGYFLYARYRDQYLSPTTTQQESPPPGATRSQQTLELQQVPKAIDLDKAQSMIELLSELQGKSEFIDNAVVNLIVSGTVEEVESVAQEIDGRTFSYKLTLRNVSGNRHTFWFEEAEVANATVFLLTTQGSQSATFGNIQKDDKLVLDITANLKDQTPSSLLIRIIRG